MTAPATGSADSADLVVTRGLVVATGIRGIDRRTGSVPSSVEEQCALAWRNLAEVVDVAGLSLAAIGLVTCHISAQDHRRWLDDGWLQTFPDPDDRPARKTTAYPLPNGDAIRLQAIGIAGARCRQVNLPGLEHRSPIPNAAIVDGYLFSSVIGPQDRGSGKTPDERSAQIELCFANQRDLLAEAGGGIENVGLLWAYLGDVADHDAFVAHYLRAWPRDGCQPARKTFPYQMSDAIQTQAFGHIGGERRNLEIPGVGHHDPIPLAAQVGPLLCTSGIGGIDPDQGDGLTLADDLEMQSEFAFAHLGALLAAAGSDWSAVGLLTILIQDERDVPVIARQIKARYPNSYDRPPYQVMRLGLKGDMKVQVHAMAVI